MIVFPGTGSLRWAALLMLYSQANIANIANIAPSLPYSYNSLMLYSQANIAPSLPYSYNGAHLDSRCVCCSQHICCRALQPNASWIQCPTKKTITYAIKKFSKNNWLVLQSVFIFYFLWFAGARLCGCWDQTRAVLPGPGVLWRRCCTVSYYWYLF